MGYADLSMPHQDSRPSPLSGAGASGEDHPQARLTWRLVRWMRSAYPRHTPAVIRETLALYGVEVAGTTVMNVLRELTWRE